MSKWTKFARNIATYDCFKQFFYHSLKVTKGICQFFICARKVTKSYQLSKISACSLCMVPIKFTFYLSLWIRNNWILCQLKEWKIWRPVSTFQIKWYFSMKRELSLKGIINIFQINFLISCAPLFSIYNLTIDVSSVTRGGLQFSDGIDIFTYIFPFLLFSSENF